MIIGYIFVKCVYNITCILYYSAHCLQERPYSQCASLVSCVVLEELYRDKNIS